ncbi:sulfurtransferase TusA family protein [Sneathiella marina]|uniref:Sulfurtransferase TusA family protein n=1 Tax=Sneathiella marina TaxID=2950108 RepID=A0ABY4WDN1_9PROT|nr:sulfurtransferase TusA family protein [Sneathiella marina]USG62726.1 sulfurtransferase TusA family protein [Sneathiella marina]
MADISLRLDTSGLNCPLPVLKAKKAIKSMAPGERIVVLATDPASSIDFQHYCHVSGNILENFSEESGVFEYVIRKALKD